MVRILTERKSGQAPQLSPVTNAEGLQDLFDVVDSIYLPPAVADYIARLVAASHPNGIGAPAMVTEYVRHGASPRAAIAIADAARAHALLAGKPNVGFDDARAVAVPAMGHRLVLDYRARLDGRSGADVVHELLSSVPEVAADLPETRA
jgi:MoxR-like ATPase